MSSFACRCWSSVGDAEVLVLIQQARLPTELLVTFSIVIKLGERHASTQPQTHQILSPVLVPQYHNHKVKQILTTVPTSKEVCALKRFKKPFLSHTHPCSLPP